MKPSAGRPVGLRRGTVVLVVAALLVAFGVLRWVVIGSVSSAQGYTAPGPSPSSICVSESYANLTGLEAGLAPSDGTSVQAGTAVTFSGSSGSPVTFAVASSSASLSSPDIDSGSGSAQPNPISGPPLYTFPSTKATAIPRTTYWDASFSSAGLPECASQSPTTYTTKAHTLTVLPTPTSSPPTPLPPLTSPMPEAEPAPVQVSIGALSSFHFAHPTVTYHIHCTSSCSGDTYYRVLVVRRHAKAVSMSKLNLSPVRVSITTESGGDEQITHNYSSGARRMLKSVFRAGGVVELQIGVKVTDAAGSIVRAQRTARLRV